MENGELENIRLTCLAIFIRMPNDYFSLTVVGQMTLVEPRLIKTEVNKLCSWGILEELLVDKMSFYRYRNPEYTTLA